MIDLDRLEKLVRLANNNSNEHEANLAARKACKLIQEGDFKFSTQTTVPPSNPVKPQPQHSQQTTKSPSGNYYYGNPYSDIFEEFFSGREPRYKDFREGSWSTKEKSKIPYEEVWLRSPGGDTYYNVRTGQTISAREFHSNKEKYYQKNYSNYRTQKGPQSQYGETIRKLKCKTCGQKFNTKFVGLEAIYECNECQWTAFQKEKK